MGKFAGFQQVQLKRPSRSAFDLTHDKRVTTRMGRLTPCLALECIPSDTFRGSSEILLRLAPLLAPIYDQIELYVHFYFVPNRLLWEDWEEFITGGRLGVGIDPVTAPVPPFYDIGTVMTADPTLFAKSSLADYLGVPIFADITGASYDGTTLDAMPFCAYQLIWENYYRDRNFVADDSFSVDMPVPSGELGTNSYLELRTRAYMHDYFTSALPFTQRGEEVLMPLQGTGSVSYLAISQVFAAGGGAPGDGYLGVTSSSDPNNLQIGKSNPTTGGSPGRLENIDEVTLDASSVSINDFRSAYALQVWLERNAVGGSRYTESVQAHFDVKPQDSRLQRPEYIGGGRIPVKISEVLSTAWSNDGTNDVPLANMAGHGVTYGNTNSFSYFCTEHGFIMGILSIMNPPSYMQGLPRMFKRRTFLDYPWPTFAKLGEQEVHDWELFATPANLTEDSDGNFPLFGYQSRYADWKYICNSNHGDFRDDLLFWTLTRVFSDTPTLSEEFVLFDDTTQDRIFAVSSVDSFWMYIHNKISVRRPLPYFGTPNTLNF